ncbi:hypothetical protein HDV00_003539 [Rhizophlyctis rosea]|nr:hypothetical protein HDV00_003539 [Rhizophlyctis rosea]
MDVGVAKNSIRPMNHRETFFYELYSEIISSRAVFLLQTINIGASQLKQLKLKMKEKGFVIEAGVSNRVLQKAIIDHGAELANGGNATVAERLKVFQQLVYGNCCLVSSNASDDQKPTLVKDFAAIAEEFGKKALFVGAKFDGMVLTPDTLKEVLELPSLAHLRVELVGLLSYPAQSMVSVLQRRPQELLMALAQHQKNLEGGPEKGTEATA